MANVSAAALHFQETWLVWCTQKCMNSSIGYGIWGMARSRICDWEMRLSSCSFFFILIFRIALIFIFVRIFFNKFVSFIYLFIFFQVVLFLKTIFISTKYPLTSNCQHFNSLFSFFFSFAVKIKIKLLLLKSLVTILIT